jgi:hypothetical protein
MAKRKATENSTDIVAVDQMAMDIVQVDEMFGDGVVYDFDRVDNEVSFYQEQAGTALLEIGKRLIRIKAHEEHGKFMVFLEKHNMGDRSAEFAMVAARKFSNSKSISNLGTTKMIALTVLDDDDIEKLGKGKAIKGIGTLDDVDRMTTRELREALRKERDKRKREKEVQEKAIAQKEAKINELDQQLRYQQPPTKEQIAVAELARLTRDYTIALAEINSAIRRTHGILNTAEKIEGVHVMMISDWLNQFNSEMDEYSALAQSWLLDVDNAGPAGKGIDAYNEEEAKADAAFQAEIEADV